MDYVSSVILDVTYERFKDDLPYVNSVKDELEENNNNFDGLMYLMKLDEESKKLFAKQIDVGLKDVECTLNLLKKI